MAQMTATGSLTGGSTPAVAVTTATAGGTETVTVDSEQKAYDALLALRTGLTTAKVPLADRFACINAEFARYLLGNDSKLTDAASAGTAAELRNGVLGRILGFTVVESALLNPGTPTAIGYHRTGAAFVNQLQKTESLRDPNSFADIVRGLNVYGAQVTKPTAVRIYASAA